MFETLFLMQIQGHVRKSAAKISWSTFVILIHVNNRLFFNTLNQTSLKTSEVSTSFRKKRKRSLQDLVCLRERMPPFSSHAPLHNVSLGLRPSDIRILNIFALKFILLSTRIPSPWKRSLDNPFISCAFS